MCSNSARLISHYSKLIAGKLGGEEGSRGREGTSRLATNSVSLRADVGQ